MVKSNKIENSHKKQTQKKPEPRSDARQQDQQDQAAERIAKRMARAGVCSRREAERWIEDGRVSLNGKVLTTPAITVTSKDMIEVDGNVLPAVERTRLWLFHKPSGVLSTNHDPEGRPTLFDVLPKELPRVITVGRLDMNTEGLLLLTNDGGVARVLELPATGWLRRYRVRVHGKVDQAQLDQLREGIAVDGVLYGSIEATLERQQGTNSWLNVALREGKNREIKKVLAAFELEVTRLIRVSYGPFQLADLSAREVREIKGRALRDQLGERLIKEAGANFDAPIITPLTRSLKTDSKDNRPLKNDKKNRRSSKPRSEDMLARLDTKPQRETSSRKTGQKPTGKPGFSTRKSGDNLKNKRGKNADRRR